MIGHNYPDSFHFWPDYMSCWSQIMPFCRTYPITRSAGARRFAVTWHPMRARPPSGGPFADWSTRGSSRWWAKAARPGTASPAARPCGHTCACRFTSGRPYGTARNSHDATGRTRRFYLTDVDREPSWREAGTPGSGTAPPVPRRHLRPPRSRGTGDRLVLGLVAAGRQQLRPPGDRAAGPVRQGHRGQGKARRGDDPQPQGRNQVRSREPGRTRRVCNRHSLRPRPPREPTHLRSNPYGRAASSTGLDQQIQLRAAGGPLHATERVPHPRLQGGADHQPVRAVVLHARPHSVSASVRAHEQTDVTNRVDHPPAEGRPGADVLFRHQRPGLHPWPRGRVRVE